MRSVVWKAVIIDTLGRSIRWGVADGWWQPPHPLYRRPVPWPRW